MKKDEAKRIILAEWRDWWEATRGEREKATGNDALAFHGYLRTEKPHLLIFGHHGDTYQPIHGWLLHARLVTD